GLRYEYFGEQYSPGSERSLDANFYYGQGRTIYEQIANGCLLPTINAPGPYRGHFYLPDHRDFAPRAGIAYNPGGTGRTVLRAGGGIFYDRLPGSAGTALNPADLRARTTCELNDHTVAPRKSVFGAQRPANTCQFDRDFSQRSESEDRLYGCLERGYRPPNRRQRRGVAGLYW